MHTSKTVLGFQGFEKTQEQIHSSATGQMAR